VATARGLTLLLVLAWPVAVEAQEGYSLVRRTPRELARPLSTDRPDRTESPYSVPAGWFQLEASAISWSRDREAGASSESLRVAEVNLKAGVLHDVDVQLVAELWSLDSEQLRGGTARRGSDGLGLVAARVKVNLWGNDGGRTALALMPYVGAVRQEGLPGTSRPRHAIAGLIVPFALEAGRGWTLGAMLEFDVANDVPERWRLTAVQSLTVGRALVGPVRGYAELFHAAGGGLPSAVTLDGGITLPIGASVQLDAGVNIGLTAAADDVNPFAGLTLRF
jgi:hypothetical protein